MIMKTMLGRMTVAAGLLVTASAANAADGYVTADSRYGSKTISAPVRRVGPNRYQVRLPHGTWFDCRISCSETLRRETIDFWENHGGGPRSTDDGPGYFYWRWY